MSAALGFEVGAPKVAQSPPCDKVPNDKGCVLSLEDAVFESLSDRNKSRPTTVKKRPVAAADAGDNGGEVVDDDEDDGDSGGAEEAGDAAPSRELMKAAKKKPVSAPAPVTLKRPGSAPATLTRPASANKFKVDYNPPTITKKVLVATTWHNFGSKVYKTAELAAKHAGMDADEAKDYARSRYTPASAQWKALTSNNLEK